jgi:hypothetical protein
MEIDTRRACIHYIAFSMPKWRFKVSKGRLQEHGRLAVAKASLNERKELAW